MVICPFLQSYVLSTLISKQMAYISDGKNKLSQIAKVSKLMISYLLRRKFFLVYVLDMLQWICFYEYASSFIFNRKFNNPIEIPGTISSLKRLNDGKLNQQDNRLTILDRLHKR